MTNTVLIKRSATANAVPTSGQLANGEIAINYADGNLFFKDSGGSVQTLASQKFVSVSGNITGGNVNTGIVSATGNVTAGNLNAAGLSLSSNVVGALVSAANITTTANIAGGYFIGNGSQLTGLPASYSNANVATLLSNFGSNVISTTGNVTTGNLTVNGNITYVNSNVVTINDKFINVANNAATAGAANGGGLGVGPVDAEYATLTFNNGTTAWNTNIPLSVNGNVAGSYFVGNGSALTSITGANVTGTVANATYAVSAGSAGSAITAEQITYAIQSNITGVGTLGNLSVSGNTTVGNLSTGGFVSATGNITGSYFIGNGSLLTGIAVSSYGNANVVANLAALGSNPISTTGNVTGGNVLGGANVNATTHTGTTVSVTGNITGGNILGGANVNATTHTGTTVSVTGNITGGNISTAGILSGANNFIINAPSPSAEGAQIVMAWANISGLVGQANSTWNLDVDATNNFRIFYQNATGGTAVPITITQSTNAISMIGALSAASLSVSTGNVTLGNIVNAGANGVGNIGTVGGYFNTVFAKATSAQYADLAEYYSADAEYEPGTVVSFGGVQEITMCTAINDPRVAGVISTNPAHVMNSGLDSEHVATVALTGRVPTLVIGPVLPGDMMVSAGGGRAKACATPAMGTVIGKALQAHPGGQGVIEVVIGRI